ncbi:MAG: hypothetical protein IOD12_08445 [Silvanigrellales bacterium]|nr:hypothetical protein [Silvanigrellales bacterium]
MKLSTFFSTTTLCLSSVVALNGCGSDSSSNKDKAETPAPAPAKSGSGDGSKKEAEAEAGRLSNGKYYLKAHSFEAFNNEGVKLDPQTSQVIGDYIWMLESTGGESYQLTMTGSVKLSNSNIVLAEFNCRGAQDVYTFEVTTSNALRNIKQVESGCPVGAKDFGSQQMQMEMAGKNSLVYTVASQTQDGVRVIETYTFSK